MVCSGYPPGMNSLEEEERRYSWLRGAASYDDEPDYYDDDEYFDDYDY